jgi:hypothetical protein
LRVGGDWSRISPEEMVDILGEVGRVFGTRWRYIDWLDHYPLEVAEQLRKAAAAMKEEQ